MNVATPERWISIAAGGALIGYCLVRRSPRSIAAAVLGGGLVYRGITGRCLLYKGAGVSTRSEDSAELSVHQVITIDRPMEDIYAFWSDLQNLPYFLRHLESVRVDGNRSHWILKIPLRFRVEWDSEIVEQRPPELMEWRSLPGAAIYNAGKVELKKGPDQRGTEVHMTITYRPPAGDRGSMLVGFFNTALALQIKEDLRRTKQWLEAGALATVEGQPSGRRASPTGQGQPIAETLVT
ncbi:MAG: SRPBCC family protein [Acidobacteriota bacterium]